MTRSRWRLPVLLAAAVLTIGFTHLRDYGVNWDEALGDLFFGQRYASFFATFDSKYLDFATDPYPAGSQPDFAISPFRNMPEQYYPLANTLAYATSRALPWLDPFDGFHAFNLLLAALFVLGFCAWLQRRFSAIVAFTAIALLLTAPRIAYDLMVNVKDFPEMVFFTFACIAFYEATERNDQRWLATAGIALGLALATKANALFIPFVWLALLIARRALLPRRLVSLIVAGAIGVAVMFALWPWLWSHPIEHLQANLAYIFDRNGGTPASMTTSPFAMLLYTTPLPLLVLAIVGIIRAVHQVHAKSDAHRFLLLWLGVVAARLCFSVNFDGVRHFLELFPPLVALAGVAIESLRPRLAWLIALAAVVPGAVGIVTMHPFEDAYWNALIGGPAGARARKLPQSGEYWATSYRQGIAWLNANAVAHAAIAVPIAEQTVAIVAPVRLRSDLELIRYAPAIPPYDRDRLPHLIARSRHQQVYVMFIERSEVGNELTRAVESTLKPVAEWKRQGVPLLRIYAAPAPATNAQKQKGPPKSAALRWVIDSIDMSITSGTT